jgi:dTDP-4-dehydrorhamnose reductase
MKCFITGASGMLGEALIRSLDREGMDNQKDPHSLMLIDKMSISQRIIPIDILEHEKIGEAVHNFRPDIIFHLAAETNVDLCETKPEYCFQINAEATKFLAETALINNCVFVYISSAAVFPGTREEPYKEEDEVGPVNIYGRSKLLGEEAVRKTLKKYFIIRAGWMFGGGALDKKFIQKIFSQISNGVTSLKVVNDKYGSPTYTMDLAQNMLDLIKTPKYGLYHMSNGGIASRYEIAREMLKLLNKVNGTGDEPYAGLERCTGSILYRVDKK